MLSLLKSVLFCSFILIILYFIQIKTKNPTNFQVKDKNESPNFGPKVMEQCHVGEDESRLVIVIERPLPQISTKQKLYAISKLASFMGLDQVYNDFFYVLIFALLKMLL